MKIYLHLTKSLHLQKLYCSLNHIDISSVLLERRNYKVFQVGILHCFSSFKIN